jgi:hypothetical protein
MRGTRIVACAILVLLIAASAVVAQIVESAGAPSGIKDGQITSRCRNYAELEPATAVTFVVVALFGGLICYHVLSKIPLPYTALLLVRNPVTIAMQRTTRSALLVKLVTSRSREKMNSTLQLFFIFRFKRPQTSNLLPCILPVCLRGLLNC